MNPFDTALCLLLMVEPQYNYGGSVSDNLEESYSSIRWEDERSKPTWEELNTWWEDNQVIIQPYYNNGV